MRDAFREQRGSHGSGESLSPNDGGRMIRGVKEARGATPKVH